MGGQLNIKKGNGVAPSDVERVGVFANIYGVLCSIDSEGNITTYGTGGGGTTSIDNLIANRGVGLYENIPLDPIAGDIFVGSDTNLIYTYISLAEGWGTSPLQNTQFITDTSGDFKSLYQYNGSSLVPLVYEQTDILAITNKNDRKLSRAFANGFFHEFGFNAYHDTGTLYCEVYPLLEEWQIGTAYVKYNSIFYNGYKYTAYKNNTGSQPDLNYTEDTLNLDNKDWFRDEPWDGKLRGNIDGTIRTFELNVSGSGPNGGIIVSLTPGTANNPLRNVIYAVPDGDTNQLILQSGTSLPLGGVIFVGYICCYDVTHHATGGLFIPMQRFTNAFYKDSIEKSLIGTMREKMRYNGMTHAAGISGSCIITSNALSKDNLDVNNTSGLVYQLWPHSVLENLNTNGYMLLNGYNSSTPTSPLIKFISDLNEILYAADGTSLLTNNARFSLEIFGISTSGTGTTDMLGVTVSNGVYASDADCINDVGSKSVTTVPDNFYYTTYRICRIPLIYQTIASGTYINLLGGTLVQDRRKWSMGGAGGGSGSGGGTGATTYLELTDTPSSRTGKKGQVLVSNDLETADVYEEKGWFYNAARTFYHSLISTATAIRSITFPDKSGTISLTSDTPVFQSQFDAVTTEADPGAGKFRINGTSTELYINNTEYGSGHIANAFLALEQNAIIKAQVATNRAKFIQCKLDSKPTAQTGYVKVVMTVEESGTAFAANDIIGWTLVNVGGGTGGYIVPTTNVQFVEALKFDADYYPDNNNCNLLLADGALTFTLEGTHTPVVGKWTWGSVVAPNGNTNAVNFDNAVFNRIEGISNGEVLAEGTYSFKFIYGASGIDAIVSGTAIITPPGDNLPEANNIAIVGDMRVGTILSASYVYYDADSDAEDTSGTGSQYELKRYASEALANADTDNTSGTSLDSGATGGESMSSFAYEIVSGDIGGFLKLWVQPKNANGTGIWYASPVSGEIQAALNTLLSDLFEDSSIDVTKWTQATNALITQDETTTDFRMTRNNTGNVASSVYIGLRSLNSYNPTSGVIVLNTKATWNDGATSSVDNYWWGLRNTADFNNLAYIASGGTSGNYDNITYNSRVGGTIGSTVGVPFRAKDTRTKIVYDIATGECKWYYWTGSAWTLDLTRTITLGTSIGIWFAVYGAPADLTQRIQFLLRDVYLTDGDYTTETP